MATIVVILQDPHAVACLVHRPGDAALPVLLCVGLVNIHQTYCGHINLVPQKLLMPVASSTKHAIATSRDLTKILQSPSRASPPSPVNDKELRALQQLTTIFQNQTQ